MTACAGSEGRSVPRTPGCSEKAAGRPRPAGSHLLPGGPHHYLAPRSHGSPDSEPSPGPARPGTSFLHRTHLTRQGCSTRGRGRPGAAGPGVTAGVGARGGVRGEPGPGVGPAAPLSVVPLFEIGAGGALRSRDGASPIGTGLSPGSGPERSASGGAAAAAGRAGKAVSGARGAAGGTRGRRPAGGGQRAAPPRLLPGSLRGRLPSGAAHVTLPVGDPLGQPWSPVQPSVLRVPGCGVVPCGGPAPSSLQGDRCSFTYRTDFTEPETRWQIGASLPGAHRLVEREHGMR